MKRMVLLCGAIVATLITFAENVNKESLEYPKDIFSTRFGSILAASIGCSQYTVWVTPITRQVYFIGAMTDIRGGEIETKRQSAVLALEKALSRKASSTGVNQMIMLDNGDYVSVFTNGSTLAANVVCKRLLNVAKEEQNGTGIPNAASAKQDSGRQVKSNTDDLWNAYKVFLDANYTSLKRDAEWEKFAGKQMTCSGRFQDAGKALLGGIYVTVIVDGKWVKLMIDPSQKDKAMSLQKGESITVTGRVSSRGDLLHVITLENGKIN